MGCLPGLATKGKWFQGIHSKLHLVHRTSCNSFLSGLPHLSLLSFLHCASSKKTTPPNTCWTLLRSLNAFKSANRSILKQISPGCSLEGLMLKLKLQYFGQLMQRGWLIWKKKKTWCWERLRAGGEGDDSGWDGWMASPIQWTWVWVISRSWWWTGRPGVLQFMGSQRVRHDWATELNWFAIWKLLETFKKSTKVWFSKYIRSPF